MMPRNVLTAVRPVHTEEQSRNLGASEDGNDEEFIDRLYHESAPDNDLEEFKGEGNFEDDDEDEDNEEEDIEDEGNDERQQIDDLER